MKEIPFSAKIVKSTMLHRLENQHRDKRRKSLSLLNISNSMLVQCLYQC
jgi:hypothetical protein